MARKRATRRRKASSGRWMQQARQRMEQKGTVGAFTRQAKARGMTPTQFANYVLSHKNRFSTTTIRRAVFAKNAGGASRRNARRKK